MNIRKWTAKVLNKFVDFQSYEYVTCRKDEKTIKAYLERVNHNIALANGMPLKTVTVDGYNQVTHPKIITNFNSINYPYIMGVTSYPYTDARYENPELLVSSDGINFKTVDKTVIDIPQDVDKGGHYSDIHVTKKGEEIFVFYRYNPAQSRLLRRSSNNYDNKVFFKSTFDGRSWTARKTLFLQTTFDDSYRYFSPVVNYSNNIFKIWFTNNSGQLIYVQSANLESFSDPVECSISNSINSNILIWHQDIVETDRGLNYFAVDGIGKMDVMGNRIYTRLQVWMEYIFQN